jgi:hypothetical protein
MAKHNLINWRNITLPGNDKAQQIVTVGNIQYCAQACKSYGGCNHLTYASVTEAGYPAGHCWLKYK